MVFGPYEHPLCWCIIRQSCVLVTLETVTLSVEQTPSYLLRMDGSLICAETALRKVWVKLMNFKLIGQRKGKTWVDLLATHFFWYKLPFPAFIICCQITCSSFTIQKQGKEWKDRIIFLGEVKWSGPYRWTKKTILVTNAWTKLLLEYILIIRPSEIVDMSDANGTWEV